MGEYILHIWLVFWIGGAVLLYLKLKNDTLRTWTVFIGGGFIVGSVTLAVIGMLAGIIFGDNKSSKTTPFAEKNQSKLLFSTPNKSNWSQQDIEKIQAAIGRFSNQCSPLLEYKNDIQSIVLDLRETSHSSLLERGWQQDAYVQVTIKDSPESIPKSYRARGQTCHYNLGLGSHIGISAIKTPCQKLCAMTQEQQAQDFIGEPREIAFEQAPQELHEKKVRTQFSSWDGSHRNLERLINDNLNDPDSYEHDRTTFSDQESHIIIRMDYRAKNAFGALVKGHVKAKVDIEGNIIEIIESW